MPTLLHFVLLRDGLYFAETANVSKSVLFYWNVFSFVSCILDRERRPPANTPTTLPSRSLSVCSTLDMNRESSLMSPGGVPVVHDLIGQGKWVGGVKI